MENFDNLDSKDSNNVNNEDSTDLSNNFIVVVNFEPTKRNRLVKDSLEKIHKLVIEVTLGIRQPRASRLKNIYICLPGEEGFDIPGEPVFGL